MPYDDEHPACLSAGCFLILFINVVLWSFGLFTIVRSVGWFAYTPPRDGGISMYLFFGIGLFQLFYIAPLLILLGDEDKLQFKKGIMIGGFLTAIANIIGIVAFCMT